MSTLKMYQQHHDVKKGIEDGMNQSKNLEKAHNKLKTINGHTPLMTGVIIGLRSSDSSSWHLLNQSLDHRFKAQDLSKKEMAALQDVNAMSSLKKQSEGLRN